MKWSSIPFGYGLFLMIYPIPLLFGNTIIVYSIILPFKDGMTNILFGGFIALATINFRLMRRLDKLKEKEN